MLQYDEEQSILILEHKKTLIFVLMTLTLVQVVLKIINIKIFYDLDWNAAFVESGDLNF